MSQIQRRQPARSKSAALPQLLPARMAKPRPLRGALFLLFLPLFFLLHRHFRQTAPTHPRPTLPLLPLLPTHAVIAAPPGTRPSDIQVTIADLRHQSPALRITVYHFPDLPLPPLPARTVSIPVRLTAPYTPVLTPLSGTSPPPLYLLAGVRLSPQALSWLEQARAHHRNDASVAAFFLDATTVRVVESKKNLAWRRRSDLSPSNSILSRLATGSVAFWPNDNPAADLSVWPVFADWLRHRRSDWYRYPTGSGVDGTPQGMAGRVEGNWTRGAWNVWFSKFLAEYRLHVVYPRLDGAKVLAMHPRMDYARDLRENDHEFRTLYAGPAKFAFATEDVVYAGDGSVVKGSGLISRDSVEKIARLGRQQGGMVSFTMVNDKFLDTARSWLCNVDGGKFRPPGLLWAVTDAASWRVMSGIAETTTVFLAELEGGKETGNEFGNPGYWKLMLERTALIGEILRNGVAVFAFETDAIWLEDPLPYIRRLVAQEADIVGTINTRSEVSGNFFHLRPTLATRRMWDEITTEFEKAYHKANLDTKLPTSWTYIENDQSLLTKLVLRNDTWRRSYPLTFLTLDMERFTDGRWYKPEEGFYTSKRARKPVLINNNFVIGVGEKTARAKKWGHWFWNEKEKRCLDSVVAKALNNGASVDEGNVTSVWS